jgi:amidohydrolase family protein
MASGRVRARIENDSPVCSGEKRLRRTRVETGPHSGLGDFGGVGDSERVPDHPTPLSGLHGFAVWANRLALERAGITRRTVAPEGGEIAKDGSGEPAYILCERKGVPLEPGKH